MRIRTLFQNRYEMIKLKKTLATLLATVMFSQGAIFAHAAESNFWKERQKAVIASEAKQSHRSDEIATTSSRSRDDNALLAALPASTSGLVLPFSQKALSDLGASHGLSRSQKIALAQNRIPSWIQESVAPFATIQQISSPRAPAKYSKTILLLQDIHLHSEAHANIEGLITRLGLGIKKQSGSILVGMEGADSPRIDLQSYAQIPQRWIAKGVADALLKAKVLNGIEAAVIGFLETGKEGPVQLPYELIGVENQSEFDANVTALRDGVALKPKAQEYLSRNQREIAARKSKIDSKEFHLFDDKLTAYEEGKLSLPSYAVYLDSLVSISSPQMRKLIEAALVEGSLNFAKVESQRSRLLEQLVSKLKEKDIQDLVQMSALFRSGQIASGDYYQHLQAVCLQQGINFSNFPEMNLYVQYVIKSESIDSTSLMAELLQTEIAAIKAVSKSKSEKSLLQETKNIYLAKKLVDFSLTENEWRNFTPSNEEILKPYQEFYRVATLRNQTMARKIAEGLSQFPGNMGLLMAGGFHTEGLLTELQNKNFTVITVTPKITKSEDGLTSIEVLASGRLPLERLFSGERMFIPVPPVTAGPSAGQMAATVTAASQAIAELSDSSEQSASAEVSGVQVAADRKTSANSKSLRVDFEKGPVYFTVKLTSKPWLKTQVSRLYDLAMASVASLSAYAKSIVVRGKTDSEVAAKSWKDQKILPGFEKIRLKVQEWISWKSDYSERTQILSLLGASFTDDPELKRRRAAWASGNATALQPSYRAINSAIQVFAKILTEAGANSTRLQLRELFTRSENYGLKIALVTTPNVLGGNPMARYMDPHDNSPVLAIDQYFFNLTIGAMHGVGTPEHAAAVRLFMERFLHELAHDNRVKTHDEEVKEELRVLEKVDWKIWKTLGAEESPEIEQFLNRLRADNIPGFQLVSGGWKYREFERINRALPRNAANRRTVLSRELRKLAEAVVGKNDGHKAVGKTWGTASETYSSTIKSVFPVVKNEALDLSPWQIMSKEEQKYGLPWAVSNDGKRGFRVTPRSIDILDASGKIMKSIEMPMRQEFRQRPSVMAVSPVGSILAIGFRDERNVLLIDYSDVKNPVLNTLNPPATQNNVRRGEMATAMAFSPDGKFISMGTKQTEIVVWKLATKESERFESYSSVLAVHVSAERVMVVSGSNLFVWDRSSKKESVYPLARTKGSASLYAAAFSPDGSRVALGLSLINHEIVEFKTPAAGDTTYNPLKELARHRPSGQVSKKIQYSPEGDQLIAVTTEAVFPKSENISLFNTGSVAAVPGQNAAFGDSAFENEDFQAFLDANPGAIDSTFDKPVLGLQIKNILGPIFLGVFKNDLQANMAGGTPMSQLEMALNKAGVNLNEAIFDLLRKVEIRFIPTRSGLFESNGRYAAAHYGQGGEFFNHKKLFVYLPVKISGSGESAQDYEVMFNEGELAVIVSHELVHLLCKQYGISDVHGWATRVHIATAQALWDKYAMFHSWAHVVNSKRNTINVEKKFSAIKNQAIAESTQQKLTELAESRGRHSTLTTTLFPKLFTALILLGGLAGATSSQAAESGVNASVEAVSSFNPALLIIGAAVVVLVWALVQSVKTFRKIHPNFLFHGRHINDDKTDIDVFPQYLLGLGGLVLIGLLGSSFQSSRLVLDGFAANQSLAALMIPAPVLIVSVGAIIISQFKSVKAASLYNPNSNLELRSWILRIWNFQVSPNQYGFAELTLSDGSKAVYFTNEMILGIRTESGANLYFGVSPLNGDKREGFNVVPLSRWSVGKFTMLNRALTDEGVTEQFDPTSTLRFSALQKFVIPASIILLLLGGVSSQAAQAGATNAVAHVVRQGAATAPAHVSTILLALPILIIVMGGFLAFAALVMYGKMDFSSFFKRTNGQGNQRFTNLRLMGWVVFGTTLALMSQFGAGNESVMAAGAFLFIRTSLPNRGSNESERRSQQKPVKPGLYAPAADFLNPQQMEMQQGAPQAGSSDSPFTVNFDISSRFKILSLIGLFLLAGSMGASASTVDAAAITTAQFVESITSFSITYASIFVGILVLYTEIVTMILDRKHALNFPQKFFNTGFSLLKRLKGPALTGFLLMPGTLHAGQTNVTPLPEAGNQAVQVVTQTPAWMLWTLVVTAAVAILVGLDWARLRLRLAKDAKRRYTEKRYDRILKYTYLPARNQVPGLNSLFTFQLAQVHVKEVSSNLTPEQWLEAHDALNLKIDKSDPANEKKIKALLTFVIDGTTEEFFITRHDVVSSGHALHQWGISTTGENRSSFEMAIYMAATRAILKDVYKIDEQTLNAYGIKPYDQFPDPSQVKESSLSNHPPLSPQDFAIRIAGVLQRSAGQSPILDKVAESFIRDLLVKYGEPDFDQLKAHRLETSDLVVPIAPILPLLFGKKEQVSYQTVNVTNGFNRYSFEEILKFKTSRLRDRISEFERLSNAARPIEGNMWARSKDNERASFAELFLKMNPSESVQALLKQTQEPTRRVVHILDHVSLGFNFERIAYELRAARRSNSKIEKGQALLGWTTTKEEFLAKLKASGVSTAIRDSLIRSVLIGEIRFVKETHSEFESASDAQKTIDDLMSAFDQKTELEQTTFFLISQRALKADNVKAAIVLFLVQTFEFQPITTLENQTAIEVIAMKQA